MLMPKFSVQRNRELRKTNRDFETPNRKGQIFTDT
jgi:hypothetical protein